MPSKKVKTVKKTVKIKKPNKFYVTTPIYYVNDVPHIGHAYTTIAADVLARYQRMLLGGDNVYFLTGTDEHGAKIEQAAEKKGITPQKFSDEVAAQFQVAWDELDISHNDFIRTTEPRHAKVVVDFMKQLKKAKTPSGQACLYESEYEGYYCVGCESFKTEAELVDHKCTDHQKVCDLIKEKNWFFRLTDYVDTLTKLIESNELLIRPETRKNEVLGLLRTGLKDVAISRQKVKWGIKLPFAKEQTVYVWVDALINYISALGGTKGELYKKFWPADVHLMAKEILKFHAVIWPAMLLALKLPLPKMIFVHGYFTIDGKKMSKSLGNVIAPDELISRYGTDATRYLLLSQFGFGTDGDFNKQRMDNLYNAALANELGNLFSRVLAMVERYCKSKVPKFRTDYDKFFAFDLKTDWDRYDFYLRNLKFDEALNVIWENIRRCNAYIDKEKPWELAKSDFGILEDVLYNLLETLRQTALMLLPFMPKTADLMLIRLGFDPAKVKKQKLADLRTWGVLKQGQTVIKGESLFPKLL